MHEPGNCILQATVSIHTGHMVCMFLLQLAWCMSDEITLCTGN